MAVPRKFISSQKKFTQSAVKDKLISWCLKKLQSNSSLLYRDMKMMYTSN